MQLAREPEFGKLKSLYFKGYLHIKLMVISHSIEVKERTGALSRK
jgi:hypothetical protein